MNAAARIRDAILNVAFPQACHVCKAPVLHSRNGVACHDCWSQTTFFDPGKSHCRKCGAPALTSDHPPDECPTCKDHAYDLARSIAVYEKAMSAAILHSKRFPVLPGIVAERIPAMVGSSDLRCEVIFPVPLSKKRYLERGFNQAEVIAAEVSRSLNLPVDSATLARTAHTPMHRAAMDRKAREMTVRNAFHVQRPNLVKGRSILLVDDIFTSGATVSHCAKLLKKSGAARVKVFTLARTV